MTMSSKKTNGELMEELIKALAGMTNSQQEEVFRELKKTLDEDEINVLREMVFFHKLYTDKAFYNTVVEELGNRLYTELRKGK